MPNIRVDVKRRATDREQLSADVIFGAASRISPGKVIGVVIVTALDGLIPGGTGDATVSMVRLLSDPDRRGQNFAALMRFVADRRNEIPFLPPEAG